MSQNDQPSLKDQIAQLEELVAWFERDDVDIEAAIEKFETGSLLATEIQQRLSTIEAKVTVLREKFDKA